MTVKNGNGILFLVDVLYSEQKIHNLRTIMSCSVEGRKTLSAIAGIYHLNHEPINLQHGTNINDSFTEIPC